MTLKDEGIYAGEEFNTLVTLNRIVGTEYDDYQNEVFKIYDEESITVPFNICMRKRAANHYLNVNERLSSGHGRVKVNNPAICFNSGLLCVMGQIKRKDPKKYMAAIEIDKESEERKIHNPFLAENFLKRELGDMRKQGNQPKAVKQ